DDCGRLALLVEDELKYNWSAVNARFLDPGLQQAMRAVFGQEFSPDKIHLLPDAAMNGIIRETLASGYYIEEKDGHFYPWPDYAYLLRAYGGKVTEEIRDYFEICLDESKTVKARAGDIAQSCREKAALLLKIENYLRKYPLSYRTAAASLLYKNKAIDYLVKISYEDNAMSGGRLSREVPASYLAMAQKYPETQPGWYAGRAAEAWAAQNYVPDSKVMQSLAEIAQQIDASLSERVKGLYVCVDGLDLFKPAGGKQYMLLVGKTGQLFKEMRQIAGMDGNYIMAELKGVTEKTLTLKQETYPRSFVVERMQKAYSWPLDDVSFPADFVCVGNRPYWRLRILTGDEAIFELPAKPARAFFYSNPQKSETAPGSGESWLYTLRGERGGITVRITKQTERDNLSGVNYQYKATVSADGRVYEGYAFTPGAHPGNPDVLRAPS
ncbi:MAG: hypothetical protein LBP78_03135, partial [Acidaminococcales bacterium]|nr:hypothetical protein [Acidaminococcales bacterium]